MKGALLTKRFRFTAALLICILLVACTDHDLTVVAQALDDTAKGVGLLQTAAISASDQQLIPEMTTRSLLLACVQISKAGQDAVMITRKINSLAPADRTNLLQILKPVIDTVASSLTIIPQNATAVREALLLIQTSLNTAQVILAAKGN